MSGSALTQNINTYFAILIVTIFGAGASLILIHVSTDASFAFMTTSSMEYAAALAN